MGEVITTKLRDLGLVHTVRFFSDYDYDLFLLIMG